jgi:RNA polymerase sigma-70 factor (ECF subfamily)
LALVFAGIRRRAIDLARREERRRRRDGEWLDQAFGEGWFVEGGIEHREVEVALRGIRADFAEVVVLKIWGGLTFDEIARTLGANAATVASRYRYALRDLQGVLEGNGKPVNPKES